MNRTLVATAGLVVCTFLVGAAAQIPQPPPEKPRAQTQEPVEKEVTLTGCLATSDEPNTFKLTHVGVAEKPATRPGEVVGTTGVKAGEALQLIGTDAEKLKAHVGHTVAVTGMLVPRKEGQAAAPAAPGRPADPALQVRADMRLNVKSFKHVDATCPPAAK